MPQTELVIERISQSVVTALANVTTDNQYSGTLTVSRPKTSEIDVDPADLRCYVWQENPEPAAAPYRQTGWKQLFGIVVYIRESQSSNVPIDRRLNLVLGDVQKALLADIRRGGLCHVDNKIDYVSIDPPDSRESFGAIWVFLQCEYRTVTGDPSTPAPTATNEMFFQGGAVLMLARKTGPRSTGPWRRYADLTVTPLIEPGTELGKDDRDGPARPVDDTFIEHVVRYEIGGEYLNADVLLWELAGGSATQISVSGDLINNVVHDIVAVDSVVPLHDADGTALFNIDQVLNVTSLDETTNYQAETDWIFDADCKREGIIKIPPASNIAPGKVYISLQPSPAVARPAIDVGTACRQHYRARIIWAAASGQMLVHGDFDASINVISVTRDGSENSATKLQLTALDDQSGLPNGRMLWPIGQLPAAGY